MIISDSADECNRESETDSEPADPMIARLQNELETDRRLARQTADLVFTQFLMNLINEEER